MNQSNGTFAVGPCVVSTLKPTPGCISVTESGAAMSPRGVMKIFEPSVTLLLSTKKEVLPDVSVDQPDT
jgi:hypothetical protein